MDQNDQRLDPEQGNARDQRETLQKFETFDASDLNNVAEFLNRDPDSDLWVFRRFGKLHLLNILCIQQRLAKLEHDLEHDSLWQIAPDECAELREVQVVLKEYDDALSAMVKFKSYRRPENHILDHIDDWSKKHGPALRAGLGMKPKPSEEADRSLYIDDLASIGALQKSWTHRFIDRHSSLRELFEKRIPTDRKNSTLIYYEGQVQRVETLLIHASFWFLLFCPIVAFQYVSSKLAQLLILAAFLLAASLLSASLLNAPNMSSLVLVAGYAAILVVFVSNGVAS